MDNSFNILKESEEIKNNNSEIKTDNEEDNLNDGFDIKNIGAFLPKDLLGPDELDIKEFTNNN